MARDHEIGDKKEIINPLRSPIALGGIHRIAGAEPVPLRSALPQKVSFSFSIQEHPLPYILGAAVFGFLAGYFLRRT